MEIGPLQVHNQTEVESTHNNFKDQPQSQLNLVVHSRMRCSCLGIKNKFKQTHRSELCSWQLQSVLSPEQELSLCEIFGSSLPSPSQHRFVQNRLVGIQGPIQNQ
uniref:Pco148511 n=1 Tax=Arundo donax TaxID=35708 RepID=A0A0A9H9A3_ARUDO